MTTNVEKADRMKNEMIETDDLCRIKQIEEIDFIVKSA